MRLVASQTKRQTYVAKVLCHEIVKWLGFCQVGVESVGQFLWLATDLQGGNTAIFFQTRVPAADFLPSPESCQLNIRPLVFPFLLLFLLVLLFFIVFTFQVGIRPVIDAPSILLGNLWIHSILVLEFHRTVPRI